MSCDVQCARHACALPWLRRRCRRAVTASTLLLLVLAGCGRDKPAALPPAPVDLLAQADAASEIVDTALVERHTRALLAGEGEARYLAAELRQIGLVPGGTKGLWEQRFEDSRRIARPVGAWVLQKGEARTSLGSRDFVPALGGRFPGARLRGLQAVFVAPTLAAPPGALASKVVVVLDPTGTAMAAGAASPLPDLFRRARAAGAHAVLVLPRPGMGLAPPSPARAAELAANSGLLAVAWLDEVAAGAVAQVGLATPLSWLPRLEWRSDLLPLPLGSFTAEVGTDVERKPHRNIVAVLPGRGDSEEVVAVVASLPGKRAAAGAGRDSADVAPQALPPATTNGFAAHAAAGRVGGVVTPAPRPADPRAGAAAAAELLAIATAFQALSDPPRRTIVFALADPGDDGLAGTRALLADARWPAQRVAAAVVLAAGNLGAPTQDLTFVGAQASPLQGIAQQVAAMQGRRVIGDPQPWRGLLWRSPAGAFLRAGVPAVLLEPGSTPRPSLPASVPMFAAAFAAPAPEQVSAPAPFAGMVEDARLAFRLALELAEGGRPPRVDAARVESALRQPVAAAQPVTPMVAQPRPPRQPAPIAGAQPTVGVEGAATAAEGQDAAAASGAAADAGQAAQEPGAAPAPELSNVPAFVAPPPGAAPPPESPRERPTAPPPPAASPTPPQR